MTEVSAVLNVPSALEERILASIAVLDRKDGLDLFFQLFSAQNPAPVDFVDRCFIALNRVGIHRDTFEFIQQIQPWYGDDAKIADILSLSRRIYYDFMVAQANEVSEQGRQKTKVLLESIQHVAAGQRARIADENAKIVRGIYRKAYSMFEEAIALHPSGTGALTGIIRCCRELDLQDEGTEFERQLAAISASNAPLEAFLAPDDAVPDSAQDSRHEPATDLEISEKSQEALDMERFQGMFESGTFEQLSHDLKGYILANPSFIPPKILAVKTYVALRSYQQADLMLHKLLMRHGNDRRVITFQLEYLDAKLEILNKGSTEFLARGLRLGATLGKSDFISAENLLLQAVNIRVDDPVLLDRLYTCQKFLGKDLEAHATKRLIYQISPHYRVTYTRESTPSLCFLADFALADRQEILADFRAFRRVHLLNSRFGGKLLTWYARIGPGLVRWARRRRVPVCIFRIPLLLLHALISRLDSLHE